PTSDSSSSRRPVPTRRRSCPCRRRQPLMVDFSNTYWGGIWRGPCRGLALRWWAEISNFGFIIFQAAGAYTAAILSMPPAATSNGGFQQYILGWNLAWPLPWIGAAVVGGNFQLRIHHLPGGRCLHGGDLVHAAGGNL